MKASVKPLFLLSSLVLTIYVMRHTDISVGNMIRRTLDEYRPSETLCQGVTTLDKAYTKSEINRAESFKENLQKIRGGNPLKTMVFDGTVTSDSAIDYGKGLIPFFAPWAVLFVLSVISAIVITCNWCCIYGCCKNAKCCKCCKAPKDSSRKRIYVVISTIFLLGGVGAGIAGLVVAGGVPKGIELTMCAFIGLAEDLEYGSSTTSDHWVGIEGAYNALSETYSLLSSLGNSAPMAAVQTEQTNVKSSLTTMKNNLQSTAPANTPIQRPDPAQGSNTYTTYYMTNLGTGGTETDDTKMTGMIVAEVDLKYSLVDAAYNNVASLSSGSTATLISDAMTTVQEYSDLIQDSLKKIGDYGKIGKTAIKGVGAGLTAIFAATLSFSLFGIGAIILVGLLKMKSFNKFLHSSWMGFTFMSIFGFLLSTIMYPTSVVLMEVCDILEISIGDNSTFTRAIDNSFNGNTVADITNLCMTGDGDIIGYFNLDSNLQTFTDLDSQFADIEAVMPISSTPTPSYTITYQDDLIDGCKSGKYADATEIGTDLGTLDGYTNHNNLACTTAYDTWVLNSVNCTTSGVTTFASGDAANYNLGSPTCIGFDAWGTTYTGDNRYLATNPFSSCGSSPTEATINSFVNRFQSNRATVFQVFGQIRTQLDSVQGQYTTFAQKIADVLTGYLNVQTKLNSIIFDADTGILKNMNCGFLRTNLINITESMCVGFVSSMYQSSVVIIICSCMSFFAMIFAFCLSKRFVLEGPQAKPKPI